jgi:hypothetical protein
LADRFYAESEVRLLYYRTGVSTSAGVILGERGKIAADVAVQRYHAMHNEVILHRLFGEFHAAGAAVQESTDDPKVEEFVAAKVADLPALRAWLAGPVVRSFDPAETPLLYRELPGPVSD